MGGLGVEDTRIASHPGDAVGTGMILRIQLDLPVAPCPDGVWGSPSVVRRVRPCETGGRSCGLFICLLMFGDPLLNWEDTISPLCGYDGYREAEAPETTSESNPLGWSLLGCRDKDSLGKLTKAGNLA